jgi:hypothetical protein
VPGDRIDRVQRDVARILAVPDVGAKELRTKGYAPFGTAPDASANTSCVNSLAEPPS